MESSHALMQDFLVDCADRFKTHLRLAKTYSTKVVTVLTIETFVSKNSNPKFIDIDMDMYSEVYKDENTPLLPHEKISIISEPRIGIGDISAWFKQDDFIFPPENNN